MISKNAKVKFTTDDNLEKHDKKTPSNAIWGKDHSSPAQSVSGTASQPIPCQPSLKLTPSGPNWLSTISNFLSCFSLHCTSSYSHFIFLSTTCASWQKSSTSWRWPDYRKRKKHRVPKWRKLYILCNTKLEQTCIMQFDLFFLTIWVWFYSSFFLLLSVMARKDLVRLCHHFFFCIIGLQWSQY